MTPMSLMFLSPLMLAGLATLALPIAAHLFRRRTRATLVFPTTRMIEESVRGQARMMKVRRWVLLALRCLALAALAVAFARPVWSSPRDMMDARQGVALFIVLDNSASSSQRAEGVSLLDTLRTRAERLVNQLRPGVDSVNVIVTAPTPHALLAQPSLQGSAAMDAMRGVKPSDGRGDLVAALDLTARQADAAPGSPRVVVLSDLQATQWADVSREKVAGVRMPVQVMEPGAAAPPNLALGAPVVFPARPHAGQRVQLGCTATNFSGSPCRITVTATLDGSPLGRREVDLAPWSSNAALFDSPALDQKEHPARFSVDDPAFTPDNAAYLVLRPIARPRVLLVTDEPVEPPQGAYFISRALAPSVGLGAEVTTIKPADLSLAALGKAEAVVVSGVRGMTDRAARALAGHVIGGGGVVLFVDDPPSLAVLESIDAAIPEAQRFPVTPGLKNETRGEPWRVVLTGTGPSVEPLAETLAKALVPARFSAIFPFPTTTVSILSFDDGTPALISKAIGGGRLVVCNFGVAPSESNLSRLGGLVVLLRELCGYAAPAADGGGAVMVGERLKFPVIAPGGASVGEWVVESPDGSSTPVASAEAASTLRADAAGFYRLKRGDETPARAAANPDPRESDLRRLKRDAAQAMFDEPVETTASGALAPSIRPRVDELWPAFLAAAIVMVALELALPAFWKT